MTKKKVGNPTLYNEEMLQKAQEYVEQFNSGVVNKEDDAVSLEVIPSVAGLALHLGVARKTVYNWADSNELFLHTLEKLSALQETALLSGGLQGRFNANIAKLALANHGYSDKQEIDTKSSDGSMTPKLAMTSEQFKEIAREVVEDI